VQIASCGSEQNLWIYEMDRQACPAQQGEYITICTGICSVSNPGGASGNQATVAVAARSS